MFFNSEDVDIICVRCKIKNPRLFSNILFQYFFILEGFCSKIFLLAAEVDNWKPPFTFASNLQYYNHNHSSQGVPNLSFKRIPSTALVNTLLSFRFCSTLLFCHIQMGDSVIIPHLYGNSTETFVIIDLNLRLGTLVPTVPYCVIYPTMSQFH